MAGSFRYLTVVLAVSFGINSGLGQIPQPERLAVEFTVFGYRLLRGIQYLDSKGRVQELRFLNSGRSQTYRYEGPNPIVFYRGIAAPGMFGERADAGGVAVGRVRIAPTMKRPLLIFFPKAGRREGREEYRIVPFDDSLRNFPRGSIVFYNATGVAMEGYVGQERVTLKLGSSEPIKIPYSIRVQYYLLHAGEYFQTFEGSIRCASNERLLLFFLAPLVQGSSEVQYRLLRDSPDEEAREPRNEQDRSG